MQRQPRGRTVRVGRDHLAVVKARLHRARRAGHEQERAGGFARQRHGNLARIIVPLRNERDVLRARRARRRQRNAIRQRDFSIRLFRQRAQPGILHLERVLGMTPACEALLRRRQRTERRTRRAILVAENLRDLVVEHRGQVHHVGLRADGLRPIHRSAGHRTGLNLKHHRPPPAQAALLDFREHRPMSRRARRHATQRAVVKLRAAQRALRVGERHNLRAQFRTQSCILRHGSFRARHRRNFSTPLDHDTLFHRRRRFDFDARHADRILQRTPLGGLPIHGHSRQLVAQCNRLQREFQRLPELGFKRVGLAQAFATEAELKIRMADARVVPFRRKARAHFDFARQQIRFNSEQSFHQCAGRCADAVAEVALRFASHRVEP